MTMSDTDVVIIGAGPNGLSVAAHLGDSVERRVFGQTMGAWRFNMPEGMILKSEPYASDLSAPRPGFLAGDYCRATSQEYHERVIPLSGEQFIGYGDWFARQLVPDVEETHIVSLSRDRDAFVVHTADGEAVRTARVVVASGIIPFAHIPPELAALPSNLVSHTSTHRDLSRFKGKEVLVVGRGQSALESAALIHEQGGAVKIVVRGDWVIWPKANPMAPTRMERLRTPVVRLCEGWWCWGFDRLPDVFRMLPEEKRVHHALGFLGPAGSWWLRERVEGQIPMLLKHRVVSAEAAGDRVRLHLETPDGPVTEEADHVIAGTGYRFDLSRLQYLEPSLRDRLRLVAGGAPLVDRHLESNVPGLFFTGALAAPSLGPLMRFVAGTHFTGPRVAGRLHASLRRRGTRAPARRLAGTTAGAPGA
jgi:cation diffusion facilitator CzcD-associated flavoprotein CzcO